MSGGGGDSSDAGAWSASESEPSSRPPSIVTNIEENSEENVMMESSELEGAKTPSQDAPSEYSDDDDDDEPLSVFKEGVKKRNFLRRLQNREENEDELLTLPSSSPDSSNQNSSEEVEEDEEEEEEEGDTSRDSKVVRDYSREGELEMLHVPRIEFPYPSYLREIASELPNHPWLTNPSVFTGCQNLLLHLSRRRRRFMVESFEDMPSKTSAMTHCASSVEHEGSCPMDESDLPIVKRPRTVSQSSVNSTNHSNSNL
jgi:hypothetical protein